MSDETVLLSVEPCSESESSAAAWILERCKGLGAPAYCIVQTLPELIFKRIDGTPKAMPEFAESFAGRIFSEEAEIRWLREGDHFRVWEVRECKDPTAHSRPCRRRERRYYLWGVRSGKNFFEQRLQASFTYPAPWDGPGADGDRAYIRVFEYLAEPSAGRDDDMKSIEEFLNQPEIVGHRFLSLHEGRNGEESKG